MALFINEIKNNKKNELMVIFRGGGKYVWYPTKKQIEKLLVVILTKEKDYGQETID